jgi:hypothetical protein
MKVHTVTTCGHKKQAITSELPRPEAIKCDKDTDPAKVVSVLSFSGQISNSPQAVSACY